MRNLDAFTAQLVDFVRRMPDDALLALVRNQLGAAGGSAGVAKIGVTFPQVAKTAAPVALPAPATTRTAPAAKRVVRRGAKRGAVKRAAAPAPAAKAPRGPAAKKSTPARGGARRGRGSAAGRQDLLSTVERIVKTSSGVSASEVAKSASVPQSRASSALKELKLAKRIFQGGDRRFARYAGDAKTAQGASDGARRSASGPVAKKRK